MCSLTQAQYKLTPPKMRATASFISFHTPLRERYFNTPAFALLAISPPRRIIRAGVPACDSVILFNLRNEDLILSDLFNLRAEWRN